METQREVGERYPAYRTLWIWLLLGWVVAYADRTVTGPVVTYMIENDLAFIAGVESPLALGGLLGSMFLAGYMLTQFSGGYLGDRFGHRSIIVISIVWAGIATLPDTRRGRWLRSSLRPLRRDRRGTLMAGWTLLQQALPTIFGLKAAGWLVAALEARRWLIAVRKTCLAAQLGGAAGTLASLGESTIKNHQEIKEGDVSVNTEKSR